VLYAEDEESDVLFMQRAFRQAGIEHLLHVVRDGQQVLDYLSGTGNYADRQRHPMPTLLLLDLNLPVLSGFAVLRWIRNHSVLHSLPLMVFTSSTRLEDKLNAASLGANAYVQKPASGAKFSDVVADLRGHRLF
jgi:CheY-like chemotaxis protein